jgi:predicted TIM-barrel fold metal-dependent hydrolase
MEALTRQAADTNNDPHHLAMSPDPPLNALADGPVTTTVTRRVKPGHEAAYEAVLAEIVRAAGRFPGFVGVDVQRPADATTGKHRIVSRFDSPPICSAGWTPTTAPRCSNEPSRMSLGR